MTASNEELELKDGLSLNAAMPVSQPLSKRAIRTAISFLAIGSLCESIPLLTLLSKHPLRWLLNWGSGTPLAWVLAALVFAVYILHTIRSSPLIQAWWLRWHTLRLLAVPAALITGFFEEALFRKFLMDYVAHHVSNSGWGLALQVLVSALVFGAGHAIWGLARGSIASALWAMYYTSLLGGAMAVVYLVGGRSMAPCIVAHIAINLVCEPWMILSAASGSWRRGN
jgi:membrane protease YdiL (CAAX protease family)